MKNRQKLHEYLKQIDNIQGWCIPQLWNCIEPIIDMHEKDGIDDFPIAEIGVFHGKFFCGLALSSSSLANHEAIDVFDLQQFNKDGAGKGDKDRFLKNLSSWDIKNVALHAADSTQLSQSFIFEREQKFSLFSVDGCHTPEHTVNDVEIAIKMTDPRGIIFVDDYYNAMWPGVQEGFVSWYNASPKTWIPFLFTCNKLFLCSIGYFDRYIELVFDFVSNHYPNSRMKRHKRFGYDSLTVAPNLKDRTFLSSQK